jgi:hypothetical protein
VVNKSNIQSIPRLTVTQFYLLYFAGVLTWSEEHTPTVFTNWMMSREEVTEENCVMKSFIICNPRQISLGYPPPPPPVAPTWSVRHPWNASFHFSFLI